MKAAGAAAAAAARRGEEATAPRARCRCRSTGRRVEIAVKQDGKVVGKANATLNLDRTLQTVFAFSRRDQGEIPFAIDASGMLHNPDPARSEARWNRSASPRSVRRPPTAGPRRVGDWLIVARKDPAA